MSKHPVTAMKHSSKSNEHLTPQYIVEPSRVVLKRIDLDPASTEAANILVRARKIYTKRDDGLSHSWKGHVFLNPPGGVDRRLRARWGTSARQVAFWRKLIEEVQLGHVKRAIFVGFSLELLQSCQCRSQQDPWYGYHPLLWPCCFPRKRIPFDQMKRGHRISGKQPSHGNVIVGVNVPFRQMQSAFGHLGFVSKGESPWTP